MTKPFPTIYEHIAQYMELSATERERWLYRVMLGLEDVVYDEGYRHVLNYPGGRVVTRQTFSTHKKKLAHKFKGLTLHSDPPRPAWSVK